MMNINSQKTHATQTFLLVLFIGAYISKLSTAIAELLALLIISIVRIIKFQVAGYKLQAVACNLKRCHNFIFPDFIHLTLFHFKNNSLQNCKDPAKISTLPFSKKII